MELNDETKEESSMIHKKFEDLTVRDIQSICKAKPDCEACPITEICQKTPIDWDKTVESPDDRIIEVPVTNSLEIAIEYYQRRDAAWEKLVQAAQEYAQKFMHPHMTIVITPLGIDLSESCAAAPFELVD